MDTPTALREAIAHAPAQGQVADNLRGVWTSDGYYLCAHCVGRILARGCGHLLKGSEHVWKDKPEPYGVCVTCEKADDYGHRQTDGSWLAYGPEPDGV